MTFIYDRYFSPFAYMKSFRIVIIIVIISKKVFRSLRLTLASHAVNAAYMIAVVEYVVSVAT